MTFQGFICHLLNFNSVLLIMRFIILDFISYPIDLLSFNFHLFLVALFIQFDFISDCLIYLIIHLLRLYLVIYFIIASKY